MTGPPESVSPIIQARSSEAASVVSRLGRQRLLRGVMAGVMVTANLQSPYTSVSPSPAEACIAAEVSPSSCADFFDVSVTLGQVDTAPKPEIITQSVTECSDGERPATRQLFNFVRDLWHGSRDEKKYTIYNCRPVKGSDTKSLHGDGRAFDVGLDARKPAQKERGNTLFAWTIQNAGVLGIQEVIWDGLIWTPGQGLLQYEGEDAHTNHVHVGLTEQGGNGELPVYQSGLLGARPGSMGGESGRPQS